MTKEKDILLARDAWVSSDNRFQRRARLLQTLWRQRSGLPVGLHRDAPLGSRLAMPGAREELSNYLTPTIRDVVRREVIDAPRTDGRLFGEPRIYNDLLSSQPLCFNLFGELAEDLDLATRVFKRLRPAVNAVTAVDFEWSPGRGDERYTGDKSAFDVFVRYRDADGAPGFIGIEMKYHEALNDPAARVRPRYDEVADAMACFDPERREDLREKPLQQVWRDHMLAGSMLGYPDEWSSGCFAFVYPALNTRCAKVVAQYRACLTNGATFTSWTIEDVVAAIEAESDATWVRDFRERYLAFERAEAVLAGEA